MFKTVFLSTLLFLASATTVLAETNVAGASAELKSTALAKEDKRVTKLEKYLEGHNSPLAPYAKNFVEAADTYNLDYRLVPAISGVESTFGKHIPYKSYNAYGWANGEYKFTSWEESIDVVSKTLREKYLDKGTPNINSIARRYAPPSSTWAGKVKFFMAKIEPFPASYDL